MCVCMVSNVCLCDWAMWRSVFVCNLWPHYRVCLYGEQCVFTVHGLVKICICHMQLCFLWLWMSNMVSNNVFPADGLVKICICLQLWNFTVCLYGEQVCLCRMGLWRSVFVCQLLTFPDVCARYGEQCPCICVKMSIVIECCICVQTSLSVWWAMCLYVTGLVKICICLQLCFVCVSVWWAIVRMFVWWACIDLYTCVQTCVDHVMCVCIGEQCAYIYAQMGLWEISYLFATLTVKCVCLYGEQMCVSKEAWACIDLSNLCANSMSFSVCTVCLCSKTGRYAMCGLLNWLVQYTFIKQTK